MYACCPWLKFLWVSAFLRKRVSPKERIRTKKSFSIDRCKAVGSVVWQHDWHCSGGPWLLPLKRESFIQKENKGSVVNHCGCVCECVGLSPGVVGQRWAWCAAPHPAAAGPGAGGSRSNMGSPWCSAVGSRGPSPSRSSSEGCTGAAGRPPRCLLPPTDLDAMGRQEHG